MTDEFDSDIQNQDDPYLLKIDLQNCRDQWHEHALKQGLEIARLRAEVEAAKGMTVHILADNERLCELVKDLQPKVCGIDQSPCHNAPCDNCVPNLTVKLEHEEGQVDRLNGLLVEQYNTCRCRTLAAQLEHLYIPGEFKCGKCGFELIQSSINMGSGAVTTDNKNDTKCLNCNVIMWRVTWQSVAEKGMASIDELFEDNKNKAAQLEQAKGDNDRYKASFDLRWKADMRAIKRWQAEDESRELTWPDHADMVLWLLGMDESDRKFIGDTNND